MKKKDGDCAFLKNTIETSGEKEIYLGSCFASQPVF